MAQKFVINNGKLVLGNVDLHRNLILNNNNKNNIIGGGYWFHSFEYDIIYFYSDSTEFGAVTKEEFYQALPTLKRLESCTIVFSEKHRIDEIVEEFENTDDYKNILNKNK